MSVGLRSYPEEVRLRVAERRDHAKTGGLGYWGARDALVRVAKAEKKRG
jgi:hypothetical protein